MRVKCLAQEHNTDLWPWLEPRPFKGTLSQASLQKLKSAKTHFTAMETYKYWPSLDKNYNASIMKLKKRPIIVIPTGAQDPNLKKSA